MFPQVIAVVLAVNKVGAVSFFSKQDEKVGVSFWSCQVKGTAGVQGVPVRSSQVLLASLLLSNADRYNSAHSN